MADLHCWSCQHWRVDGCAKGKGGWPHASLEFCDQAAYEPGADESEITTAQETA